MTCFIAHASFKRRLDRNLWMSSFDKSNPFMKLKNPVLWARPIVFHFGLIDNPGLISEKLNALMHKIVSER